jgi:Tol biopolymer transport system component
MRRLVLSLVTLVLLGLAVLTSRLSSEAPHPAVALHVRAFGPLHPRLSPAGDRIVFSYQGSIWTLPASGGVMTCLTSGPGYDIEPAWSADGKRIAYLQARTISAGQLRVVSAEDTAPVELPATVQANGKLAFHPDGRRVLGTFQSAELRGEGLAWFDITTGKLTSVLDPPRAVRRPALSANGRWIAYATNRDVPGQQGGNDGPQADLWKVAAAGGKPEKIGTFPARIHDLCWAADGASLTITTDLGGAYYDLWQVPLDDPARGRKLTFGQADEDRPSLSGDGQHLLFTDNHEGCTALVLRDLRTGNDQTLVVSGIDYRRPTGALRLQVRDKATGAATTARLSLIDKNGKLHAPPGALYRIERSTPHFYARDAVELRVPAGEYQLRAYRGPEHRPFHQALHVDADRTTEATVAMERWVDGAALGWYSGENHIHANYGYGEWYNTPETMLLQCEGEDLNVCNFMVANSDGDGVFDRSFFRGRPDPLSRPRTVLYWNEEYRSTIWGHMTLVNLSRLVEPIFTGFKDTTNPLDVPTNADTAERTRRQRGLVNYTHVAYDPADPYLGAYTGKGLPVDAALGRIDTVDLNATYAVSVPLWYRLLNCGLRLGPSAGTDCFLNRVASRLPGSDRAYVQMEGDFSYAKWIEGLRAGRSFITNGPFVELTVGKDRPGGTVHLAAPGKVRMKAKAWWQFPLAKAELVQDGKVIDTKTVAADKLGAEWEVEVECSSSGWLAVRASGPPHADHPADAGFAHTAPVYIEVAGHPARARADAQYFLKWIDRLDVALRERDRIPAEQKARVQAQLEAARAVFTRLGAE